MNAVTHQRFAILGTDFKSVPKIAAPVNGIEYDNT